MNARCRKLVLVLLSLVGSTLIWTGCAGMAEPLPSLAVAPASLTVSAKVGTASALPVTITNTGTTPLSVTQAILSGTGFSMSGLATPVTLPGGQSTSFTIKFAASQVGVTNGNVEFMTDSRHAPHTLPLHGTGSSQNPVVASIVVSPRVATPAPSAKVQFTAAIQGATTNDAVTWAASIGTISATGAFTAPPVSGIGMIVATSVADPTKSATATVAVADATPPPSGSGVTGVTVTPRTASSVTGGALQFKASVAGKTSNTAVTWKASLGTITSAGGYTAPAKAGADTVTATSVADPTKSATATVAVAGATPPPGVGSPGVTSVTVLPGTASSITGGTLQFKATVAGTTSNTAVVWKALLGTITATGNYTAPSKTGTDTVTATSIADSTKSGSASVKVTAPGATPVVSSISISPTTSTVTTGGSQQFKATVQGTVTDTSVTWTAALGTVNSSGAYTAPAKAGTDTVTATSNADTTKSASATVTATAPSNTSSSAACSASNCPAFPGAEGGGAASVGGRGGAVFEVTNLNDSGSGSLRSCIEASGPRTCIFRVGGVINVIGDLRVYNPYLTIAGQTAPGGGIKLTGMGAIMWVNTHDVVIRYIGYDGNSPNNGPSAGSVSFDAGSGTTYNVIFDHVSGFHVTNKQLIVLCNDAGPVKDVTFQWSMTYKPDANHPVGPMADATTCQATTVTNIDYHHNFFADTSHRLPLFNVKSGRWVSNLVYNWDWFGGLWQGGTTPDIINNNYIHGNMNIGDNGGHPHQFEFTTVQSTDDTSQSMPGPPSAYLSGNIGLQQSNPAGDQTLLTGQVPGEGQSESGPVPSGWFRGTPLPTQTYPITADPAASLSSILFPTVGNSQQLKCDGTWNLRRQTEDNAMIAEYQNGTPGSFWTAPSGYTTAPVSNGTACTESLHDGIPDQWKVLKGLSTTDSNLNSEVAPNGYTWLENYLNGQ